MGSVSYKFYSFWMVSVLSSTYRISVLLVSKDYYIGASRWFHLMDSSLLWWRAFGCSYVVLSRSSNRILLLVLIDNGWCLPPSRLINRRKGVRRFAHLSDDRLDGGWDHSLVVCSYILSHEWDCSIPMLHVQKVSWHCCGGNRLHAQIPLPRGLLSPSLHAASPWASSHFLCS